MVRVQHKSYQVGQDFISNLIIPRYDPCKHFEELLLGKLRADDFVGINSDGFFQQDLGEDRDLLLHNDCPHNEIVLSAYGNHLSRQESEYFPK